MDRNNIINNYSKSEFMDFLENDFYGDILELFNAEGIEILNKSKIKEDRINYILYYSKFKNELLQNMDFLDLLLKSDISKYYANMKDLDNKTYEVILNRCLELNMSENIISRLFTFFSDEFKLYVIENKLLSNELIINILNKSYNTQIVQKILDTYNIDLCDSRINIKALFEKGKKSFHKKYALDSEEKEEININPSLITKDLAEKLWNENNIFYLRKILNDAQYSTDISVLNNYVKNKEDEIIGLSTSESLLYPYDQIYKNFRLAEESNKNDILNIDNILEARHKFNLLCRNSEVKNLDNNIRDIYLKDGIKEVFNYIKKLSDRNISNYIIDYHFEENYHNINLDLNELLQYYYDGNIVIDRDRVSIYESIVNIDYLSVEEKIQLHNVLKQFNLMEMLYDDMRMARDMVNETIKDYSLSSETIYEFKDEKLSNEYGVDVFKLEGQEFFGIVKTGRHVEDRLPTGHSYSLVGSHGLAVFGDPHRGDTFLYDSDTLRKEQVVHVYPYDSYTMYRPFEYREEASMRVSTLMTPEDIVSESKSYSEILVLEEGYEKNQIDEYIPKLQRLALYCLDEITQKDVEIAKGNGVGIILIDSSKYEELAKGNYMRNGFSVSKYNYFNGSNERDMYEERRL